MFSGSGYLASAVPPLIHKDLSGKVVMIVGATTGLGFEAAKHFASMNPAKFLITARDEKKAQDTVLRIAGETGYRVDPFIVDLSDFSSVRAFVDEVEKNQTRLDYLILNAAAATFAYKQTKDQWETTLQVNHLSTSWIALRLLPLLQSTAKKFGSRTRVVIVSSGTHTWVKFDDSNLLSSESILSKLNEEEYATANGAMEARYPQSKLLNVLLARALAERYPLSENNVVINSICPGFCRTELARDASGFQRLKFRFMWALYAHTAEEGSRELVYGALGHSGEESESQMHGSFNQKSQIKESSEFVKSEDGKVVQDRIWKETIDILSKQDPALANLVQRGAVPSV